MEIEKNKKDILLLVLLFICLLLKIKLIKIARKLTKCERKGVNLWVTFFSVISYLFLMW